MSKKQKGSKYMVFTSFMLLSNTPQIYVLHTPHQSPLHTLHISSQHQHTTLLFSLQTQPSIPHIQTPHCRPQHTFKTLTIKPHSRPQYIPPVIKIVTVHMHTHTHIQTHIPHTRSKQEQHTPVLNKIHTQFHKHATLHSFN